MKNMMTDRGDFEADEPTLPVALVEQRNVRYVWHCINFCDWATELRKMSLPPVHRCSYFTSAASLDDPSFAARIAKHKARCEVARYAAKHKLRLQRGVDDSMERPHE